ncbi:MAG: dephospho-CoA kinase [Spirochaetales bacterium]|jgi:dephospho-CoA kinase|nr:dephospho-CoA kinase [Spirochaetales bacterium]
MVIGLAGKYCSGKSEAARILGETGFRVIDVDALGHEALDERRDEVAAAFGERILAPDGRVDRRKLGGVVFADSAKLKTLEAIVHPRVREKITSLLEASGEPSVIHAALLFSGGLDKLCDHIIIITAPLLDRINRGLARDSLGIMAVFRRIWKQRSLIPQSSYLPADTIIVRNSGTRKELREAVLEAASHFT